MDSKQMNRDSGLVTVIVPVYNVQPYIAYCLDSLVHQTYRNMEILLINDGSTDDSLRICRAYSRKDSRMRVITQKNQGLAGARNTGLDNASGDFIAFIDADDFVAADYIECLLQAFRDDTDISMCPLQVTGHYFLPPLIQKHYRMEEIDAHTFFADSLQNTNDLSACGKMFRRQCISPWRFPPGRLHEDIFIMADVVMSARKIVLGSTAGYFYVKRKGSITTSDFNRKKLDLIEADHLYTTKITDRFPDLRDLAAAFTVHGYSAVIKQIPRSQYREYQSCIAGCIKQSRRHIVSILKNHRISGKEKVLCMITCTDYDIIKAAWKIYDAVKYKMHNMR